MSYRVIGVGAEDGLLSRLDSLLADSRGELYRVAQGRSAIEMVKTLGPVDLVLLEFPLAEMALTDFFRDLYRAVEVPPRVAVLSAEEHRSQLPDLSSWNNMVLSFEPGLEELAAALRAMLERAPRVTVRLMVRLEVEAEADRLLRLAQTENISKSGMLVRTDEEFPPESTVRFELSFPEDPKPVCGRARVVRQVEAGGESLRGVGVKFQALLGSDQLRLERFLTRALEIERAGAGGDRERLTAVGG